MVLMFESVVLDSVEKKGSYGIGLQIGQQLLSSGLDVVPDAVAKGIFDMLNQNESAVTDSEITEALHILQSRAEEAQRLAFKALEEEGKRFLEENRKQTSVNETQSGLQYEILVVGNGAIPTRQNKVSVHYTGSLIDGTVFDSSVKRGSPATFPVNGVIAGWTEALTMMPVGSKWRLFIPSQLGYGERGAGPSIPPFSTLIFEVELLDIL